MSFGIAVAYMMFIKELQRNVGGTAATAKKNTSAAEFLQFLAELDIFETFETILFF